MKVGAAAVVVTNSTSSDITALSKWPLPSPHAIAFMMTLDVIPTVSPVVPAIMVPIEQVRDAALHTGSFVSS